MELLIAIPSALSVGFGLGWYVKGRGNQGVINDLNNAKNEIETLKAKVSG